MGFLSRLFEPKHGLALLWMILAALVVGGIVIAALCALPSRYRKWVVVGVTFVAGLFYSIEFLIPRENYLTARKPLVADLSIVIGSFAVLIGITNLFQIHWKSLSRMKQGMWYNGLAFFVSFFAILTTGFLKDSVSGSNGEVFAGAFDILFTGFLTSLNAATFSLVAFYIVSAAYRSFRIRSAESALLMIAAAIVMLALVPVGALLTDWLPKTGFFSIFRIERMGYWILTSPNMAAQRAMALGIAVGSLAMGLRIWLSLEKGSFFDRQL